MFIIKNNKYNIKYFIGTGFYTIEWLLPLYYCYPGQLVYTKNFYKKEYINTVNYIKNNIKLNTFETNVNKLEDCIILPMV